MSNIYLIQILGTQSSSKKVRGCSRMPELVQRVANGKEKLHVEFDELSVPHEGRTKFASDLGIIARSKAPVGAKNWKNDVSPTIKDSIWEDIRVK